MGANINPKLYLLICASISFGSKLICLFKALNIKINLEPNEIEAQINKNNFGFMFAPNYHSAMKFVGPTRKKIGKRTIFNMIGPLSSYLKVQSY